MKRFLPALFLLSTACSASAQTRIAIRGGITYSTEKVKDNGVKPTAGYKPGASIGIQFKVPFDGPLHFSPYAAYNMRASKSTYPTKVVENTIHYLDLVPALSLDLPVANANTFVIGFGPVFGFTNFGRQKITQNGTTTSQKMSFGYGAYGWFDLGLTGSIGFHTKKVYGEAVYFHGLANINNNEAIGDLNIQNRMFNINFGYYLK